MTEKQKKMQTVLVVDDTRENVALLTAILSVDYIIMTASRGLEALEIAHKSPPDLVLLDIMMPAMNGYDVCKALKQDAVTKKIPVIFVTTLLNPGDETRGFEAGGVDYITKPLIGAVVRSRVRAHLALKEAQDEVEMALEKYTDLYDFAPVGYVTLDCDGTITAANLTSASLLGGDRSSLIGGSFGQFIAASDVHSFTAFLKTVFSSCGKKACEVALLNKEHLPLIVQIEAMATASGDKCRLALIDITERRQVEDALRESEERMYKLAEMAVDAIVMLDENGTVTFCNAAAETMFGCPGEEISGRDFHRFFIPEQFRSSVKQGFDYFMVHGTGPLIGARTEVEAIRKDGTEFSVELSVSAQNIRGKRHSIGIMRDVSERKLAEERIREVSRQQQAILDNIPNIAWLKDREGRYVAVNEPFCKSFDASPPDLVGKNDYDIYPAELAAKYEQDFSDVMATGMRTYSEESIVDKKGNFTYLEKIKTPIFNDAGAVIGVIGIAHDVTSRKEVEVSLRHDSTHDALTSLYNRAFFDEELDRFAHSRMFPMSIVMADVNGLKTVNDTLGHDAGDTLIRTAARIILGAFRAEDIVARIGGDEFAVLLPETDMAVAEDAVGRIKSSPEIIGGQVSIAFGVATAQCYDQLAEALKLSDERMYLDKSAQKGL